MEATPENLNWANTVLIFKKAEGKKSRNYREIIDGCLGLGRQPSTLIKSIGSGATLPGFKQHDWTHYPPPLPISFLI